MKRINEKGQVFIVFVLFISFMVPIFLGTINYMHKIILRVDNINKLDIVAISSLRAKSSILNQISWNNQILIDLVRVHGILNSVKNIYPPIIPIINTLLIVIEKAVNLISKFNKFLYKSSSKTLQTIYASLLVTNRIKVLVERSFFSFYLKKISKSALLKKMVVPYKNLHSVNIYVPDQNFKEGKKSNFKFYEINKKNIIKTFINGNITSKNDNHLIVSGEIINGNMFNGGFDSKLFLVLKK